MLDGSRPALDYIDGTDKASNPKRLFRENDFSRLTSILEQIRFGGTQDLLGSPVFTSFIGEDKKDAMCELRIKAEQGHRFLCFKRDGQRFVIACGFLKPPQYETPKEQKVRARSIMAEYESPKKPKR